jgi:hypothetical protein
VHDYAHYYNHERIKLGLKGLSPVEYRLKKHRLIGGIVTVQLLGVSSNPGRFSASHYTHRWSPLFAKRSIR